MAERDRVERVTVEVPPGLSEEFVEAAIAAGWTDDPGTGKSVMIDDPLHPRYGAEIPNPTPMAPPVGYVAEDTLQDMINRHMAKIIGMQDSDVIDSEEEVDDFDVEDELPEFESVFEVREMVEEAPAIPVYTREEYTASLVPPPHRMTAEKWREYLETEEKLRSLTKPAPVAPVE